MKNLLKVAVLAGSIFLGSCSSDDDGSSSISDSNLSGSIFGESFTAAGGQAFDSGDYVSINITNVSGGCDSDIFDYDLYVSTTVALEEGTTSDTNVVLHKEGETPLNILGSEVIVDEITDTTITVRIIAESSSEQTVEGSFTVDYCN